MIETIVQVESGKYPFDETAEKGQAIRVEDIQYFNSSRELAEKKSEMIKKTKLVKSHYIVKLLKIYEEDYSLHYLYEHVPYSFQNYIARHYRAGSRQIVEMSSKLFLKKISYELAMLISYLIDMKIQIDLSVHNVGLTEDEKIKVFMNSRCRMGHKTEVSLIIYYNSRKEKILAFVEKQLQKNRVQSKDKEKHPGFVIKGNRLVFPEQQYTENYEHCQTPQPTRNQSPFGQFQGGFGNFPLTPDSSNSGTSFTDYENMFFSAPNVPQPEPEPEFERQATHSCIGLSHAKNIPQQYYSRNTTHNLGRAKNGSKTKREAFSANKGGPKSHKNSFHFGNYGKRDSPKNEEEEDEKFDSKSFTHSKSVRIEFQQKMNNKKKKDRKDSYKVKITTFHEYEMDNCDPKDLFTNVPQKQQDIFDYFSKQGQNAKQRHSSNEDQEEEKPRYSSQSHIPDPDPDLDTPKSPSYFVRKESMPEYVTSTVGSSTRTLEEKVRMAKEKAQNVLSKYMNKKKSCSIHEESPPRR